MAKTYLDVQTVHHNFQTYSYENVLNELNQSGDNTQKELLEKFPDSFPFLYSLKSRHLDDATFEYKTKPAERESIVPESEDVRANPQELMLQCQLADAGTFNISVKPYDQTGNARPQLKGRIDFPQETIENLNAQRLQKIFEFCEQHGFSVWDMSLPYHNGVIDLDEKLGSLTQQLLEAKRENTPLTYEDNDQEENIQALEALAIQPKSRKKSKSTSKKTLADIHNKFIDLLENDMHCTYGLTYFKHKRKFNGYQGYEFSIYDKPNKDNEKEDGRRDKNNIPVPTYRYRLYVSQDENGHFYFGYSAPQGKKIDDAMAGDIVGVIKETGATHINFSNLTSAEKGVWLTACAEKGIVPIGISINIAKAKGMLEAAKKKLTEEEYSVFATNLAAQMKENAAAKGKQLANSEINFIVSFSDEAKSMQEELIFKNFREIYNTSLAKATREQIAQSRQNVENRAAIVCGSLHTLRTIFDIYDTYKDKTFGDFLNAPRSDTLITLTQEEREKLQAIPANTPMSMLGAEEYLLIYNTLLPKHIEQNRQEIIKLLDIEDTLSPKRAQAPVITEHFNEVKGYLSDINAILKEKGLKPLDTISADPKTLAFKRPPKQNTSQTNTVTNPTSQTRTR